jgi:ATP-dependent Clp protease, protease subunit
MSLRQLPEAKSGFDVKALTWDPPADVLEKWAQGPVFAEAKDGEDSITIFDMIGQNWDGTGITAKRIDGALRAIGAKNVTVKINSPGGNVFDGLAIYNLLREHKAKVTVKVMGYAASAASIIAMAGDEIQIAQGAFFMVHKAWGLTIGNEYDHLKSAETFRQIDASMSDIYQARTGQDAKAMKELMDGESWIGARDAVDKGFADSTTEIDSETKAEAGQARQITAKRRIDAALAKSGVPRSERRELYHELQAGTQNAPGSSKLRAGDFDVGAALRLLQTLRS